MIKQTASSIRRNNGTDYTNQLQDGILNTGFSYASNFTLDIGFQFPVKLKKYKLAYYSPSNYPGSWEVYVLSSNSVWIKIGVEKVEPGDWKIYSLKEFVLPDNNIESNKYRITFTSKGGGVSYSLSQIEFYTPEDYKNKFLLSSNEGYISYVDGDYVNENIISSNSSDFADVVSSSSEGAWRLFDGDLSIGFQSTAPSSRAPTWIIYDFKVPTQIDKYRISPLNSTAAYSGASPKDWTLQGSYDGFNWSVIDYQSNVNIWIPGEPKEFLINARYNMYKLNITAKGNGTVAGNTLFFAGFDLMSKKSGSVIYVPTTNEEAFVKYGLNKGESIYNSCNKKIFISDNATTVENGKIFKHTLDRSSINIKKVSIK